MGNTGRWRATDHVLNFAGIGVHAACCLTGFNVTPDHGCHVTFVVHETSIKVRCFVWVRGDDVGLSTREWILEAGRGSARNST
jgi:hypothetical protein